MKDTAQKPAQDMSIAALDGHALMATCFQGSNPDGPVVLISSGTAIPRWFYFSFAEYIAARGASQVVTYDYRGIGDSWPDETRTYSYLISDWIRYDYPALIDWIRKTFPDKKLYTIGHSFGGQAVGLTGRNRHIDRAMMVTMMNGYWGKMAIPARYWVYLNFFVLLPVIGKIYNYIPGKFGLGEDMARSAVRQWASWCRDPDYFFKDPLLPETKHFSAYRSPLLSIGLDDDDWGRPQLIDYMLNHFKSADITKWQFSPEQAGGKVGHLNFFKPRFKETLWKPAIDWLFDEQDQSTRLPSTIR